MNDDAGLVLYVIAKDAASARPPLTRGPRRGIGLTKSEIAEEVERLKVELPEDYRKKTLDPVCESLIDDSYLKLKGKRYLLHPKATKPTLIQDKLGAQFVLSLYGLVQDKKLGAQFAPDDAATACASSLSGASPKELLRRLKSLARIEGANYFKTVVRGEKFELEMDTIEEERAYLECVVKYDLPSPVRAARSRVRRPRRPSRAKPRKRK